MTTAILQKVEWLRACERADLMFVTLGGRVPVPIVATLQDGSTRLIIRSRPQRRGSRT